MKQTMILIIGFALFINHVDAWDSGTNQITSKRAFITDHYYQNNKRLSFKELNKVLKTVVESRKELHLARRSFRMSVLVGTCSAYLLIKEFGSANPNINHLKFGVVLSPIASLFERQMHSHYQNAINNYNSDLGEQ